MKRFQVAGITMLSLLLTACGGGGGGGTATVSPPQPAVLQVSTVVTAGSGTFTPESAAVTSGQSSRFVLTPAAGFVLDAVTGCGGTLTGQTYQTAAVTAACTVSATFKPLQYNLTATAGMGGRISPATLLVSHGQSASFNLTPDTDYTVAQVTGCGGTLTGNSYQISAVTSGCAVSATFIKSFINVTTTAGAGGSMSPASVRAATGATQQFILTPNAGYEITSVSGCNGTLQGNTYTTAALTQDCTVTASFNLGIEVVFPDAALQTAVRRALSLNATEPVLKSRLASLTTLQVASAGIQQLQGLQFATGLRRLNANNNQITDLSPLKNLLQLTDLELSKNPLQDLAPLAALSLQTLDIANTKVADLSALASMPLITLDVSSTAILNIAALQNVSALRYLSASYTKLADLTSLQTATKLQSLYLYSTWVSKLEPLLSSGLNNRATVLRVSGCIDQKGYSRATLVLNQLKAAGADAQDGTTELSDCPDTLGSTAITASSYQENDQLGLRWQISNAPDNGGWACEVHVDLQTDVARLPLQKISNCSLSGQQLLDLSTRQNSYQLSLLFDNGLGGEKLVRLPLSVPTGASPVLAGLDFGQVVMKSNPLLVPARDALLRLHVIAATAPAQLPVVTVEATGVGSAQTLTAKAPSQIPVTVNYQTLTNSYQLQLPANLMQPGLKLAVRVNGELLRTVTPSFASQNKLAVLLVPFSLGSGTELSTAVLPDPAALAGQIKAFWPLAEVDIRTRAAYPLKSVAGSTTAYTMLEELSDLRAAENGKVYYYGYFKSAMGDGCCGGVGYRPGYTAVGIDSDLGGEIMVHELGHNLNLQHINCGSAPTPDLLYPYSANSIGSIGVNSSLTELRQPNSYRDVMSYCTPKHVSDYHFEKAQDYLIANPAPAFATAAAASVAPVEAMAQRSLYISGRIHADGQLSIRTVLPVSRAPEQYPASEWEFRLINSTGQTLQVNPLLPEYGHPAEVPIAAQVEQPFQVEVQWQDISRLELWRSGKLLSFIDVSAQAQALSSSPPDAELQERANQVCLAWPAQQGLSVSLLHHQTGQVTALALNETSGQFCRDSQDLVAGGQWQLVWRRGFSLQEQWLLR